MGKNNHADEELTSISGVKTLTGYHEVTVWRKVRDGEFPKPIYLGAHRRWRVTEIREWIAAQAAAPRPSPVLRGCVARAAEQAASTATP